MSSILIFFVVYGYQALDPLTKYFITKLSDVQPKLLVAVLQRCVIIMNNNIAVLSKICILIVYSYTLCRFNDYNQIASMWRLFYYRVFSKYL